MSIKKSRLFYFRIIVFIVLFVIFLSCTSVFAEENYADKYSLDNIGMAGSYGNDTDGEHWILKTLGFAFNSIAKNLYGLMGDASMDNLIYGGDTKFGGLTLFKEGPAQNFLAQFYNLFNIVAIIMFIPIVYWSIITFARAGDNPQGKSILKDRITKILLTFVFLYTMPQLLTILVKISNTFVDIFKIGVINPIGEYISEILESDEGSSFVNGITALMLVGVNLWMVFFYIIRDLTISFLFMFFPIVAIWFPLSQNMVFSWWKNMASNILTQPIHAVILSLVITMASAMNVVGMGALGGLYMIVAFGSIIPMTGIIKGFLGLEGGVGAASSRAGMGGMIAAMSMMRMTGRNIGINKGRIKEGLEEKSILSAEEKSMDKNLEQSDVNTSGVSSSSEMNRPLVNPNIGNISSKNELLNRKREANKKIAKGAGSLVAGGFTGMVGASLGGGLGGRVAMTTGMVGYGLGAATGGFASEHVSDITSGMNIAYQDSQELGNLQLESARELSMKYDEMEDVELRGVLNQNPELYGQTMATAKDKLLGIHNTELTNTPQQAQLRNAMMKQRSIANMGSSMPFRHFSRQALINNAPSFKSNEEIVDMSNNGRQVSLYQDSDMSYLYTNNSQGQLEVLKRGPGIQGMTEPINNPISFNNNLDIGMAGDYALQYELQAEEQASSYMKTTYPEMNPIANEKYDSLYKDKMKDLQKNYKHNYNDNLKLTRENLGISNLNILTNQARAQQFGAIQREQFKMDMENQKAAAAAKAKETNHVWQNFSEFDPLRI